MRTKIKREMIKIVLAGIVILLIAVLLMGIRVFFSKKGEFPNTHIGASKEMQKRGISCATSQDREMTARQSPVERILQSENL